MAARCQGSLTHVKKMQMPRSNMTFSIDMHIMTTLARMRNKMNISDAAKEGKQSARGNAYNEQLRDAVQRVICTKMVHEFAQRRAAFSAATELLTAILSSILLRCLVL